MDSGGDARVRDGDVVEVLDGPVFRFLERPRLLRRESPLVGLAAHLSSLRSGAAEATPSSGWPRALTLRAAGTWNGASSLERLSHLAASPAWPRLEALDVEVYDTRRASLDATDVLAHLDAIERAPPGRLRSLRLRGPFPVTDSLVARRLDRLATLRGLRLAEALGPPYFTLAFVAPESTGSSQVRLRRLALRGQCPGHFSFDATGERLALRPPGVGGPCGLEIDQGVAHLTWATAALGAFLLPRWNARPLPSQGAGRAWARLRPGDRFTVRTAGRVQRAAEGLCWTFRVLPG